MKKTLIYSAMALAITLQASNATNLEIGDSSVAIGDSSITTGKNSVAIGKDAVSTGSGHDKDSILNLLEENKKQLAEIEKMKEQVANTELTYAEKLEVYNRVEQAKKQIKEKEDFLKSSLNPEYEKIETEYNQFKPEYDRIVKDMNERLDMISYLDFELVGTDKENGLKGLATELKTSVEDGYNFSLDLDFYEKYIENYIEAQGMLKKDEKIYNDNRPYILDENGNRVLRSNKDLSDLNNKIYIHHSDGATRLDNGSEYYKRNNAESLNEDQYNQRVKNREEYYEEVVNHLNNVGESQFFSDQQKQEFFKMEQKKMEIDKKVLLSKKLQQDYYDLAEQFGDKSPEALNKLSEREKLDKEIDSLVRDYESIYTEDKVNYIIGQTSLKEFKKKIDDIKNGNIESKKQLEDSFKQAIKETTDHYEDLKKKLEAKEAEIAKVEREIAQLQPTEKELKEAKEAEVYQKKLEAEKKALEEALANLDLNDLKNVGKNSIAIGTKALVTGSDSIAIGAETIVTGSDSIAVGNESLVTGSDSILLGNNSLLTGDSSIGIGNYIELEGNNSLALGSYSKVLADNAIAIGENSIADEENTVSFGNEDLQRKLVNVADGEIAKGSKDAVNGGQIHDLNEKIEGDITNLDNKIVKVEGDVTNLDNKVVKIEGDVTNLDNKIVKVEGDVTSIINGEKGLFQIKDNEIVIDNEIAKDANKLNIANKEQDRTLTGVANGKIAKGSKDAVNGGQLFSLGSQVANIFGGGAYIDENNKVVKIEGDVTNLDNKVVKIEGDVTNLDNKVVKVEGDVTSIINGEKGLFQIKDNEIVVDNEIAKDANGLNIANKDQDRTLTGVADGEIAKGSKDAVNGAQIHDLSDRVTNIFGGGAYIDENGNIVSPEYLLNGNKFDNVGDSLTYLADQVKDRMDGLFMVEGDKIVLNQTEEVKQTTTVDLGERILTGVANGKIAKDSKDAVNGGQLFETNQQVAYNTYQIQHINNTLKHYDNRLNQMDRKIDKNRKVASAGIAGAMAMSSIPYATTGRNSNFSFGMGTAYYDDAAAIALGIQGRMTEASSYRVQMSYNTEEKFGASLGFAVDF